MVIFQYVCAFILLWFVVKAAWPDTRKQRAALTSRKFVDRKGEGGDGTVFRPAFPDATTPYTGLPHDTIATYLLRDFVGDQGSSIFAALKADALVKRDAAHAVLRENISGFRKRFEQQFNK